jgi:hypothetical protein
MLLLYCDKNQQTEVKIMENYKCIKLSEMASSNIQINNLSSDRIAGLEEVIKTCPFKIAVTRIIYNTYQGGYTRETSPVSIHDGSQRRGENTIRYTIAPNEDFELIVEPPNTDEKNTKKWRFYKANEKGFIIQNEKGVLIEFLYRSRDYERLLSEKYSNMITTMLSEQKKKSKEM